MKLLINCRDDYEANVIEGLLKVAGIPVHKQYRGIGEAMKFFAGVGQDIDIYVPADRLEEARLLLESSHELDE
ncbi:MAG: putative signal transducing protein [Bacillota bacterium]